MDALAFAHDGTGGRHNMNLKDRIGAWLTPAGCFFRVWAPNAIQVTVLLQAGPNWKAAGTSARYDLSNTSGYWSASVPGVTAGQLYRFEMKKPDGSVFQQLDAAARRGQLRSDPR